VARAYNYLNATLVGAPSKMLKKTEYIERAEMEL
jgi:hypothetical protein